MGAFLGAQQARFTTNTLNDQFGPQNIAATFATIEELRKTYPNLLNAKPNPGPREKRRQTLRFAAFLLNGDNVLDGTYPAARLNGWFRWLTWLFTQTGGTLKLNNTTFQGSAGDLVLKVMAQALPPNGQPSPIQFTYSHDSNLNHFKVEGTTIGSFHIEVTSPKNSEVNGTDEDDVP